VGPAGEQVVDAGLLPGEAEVAAGPVRLADHVDAGDVRRALVRAEQRGQDADRGGLAGAVRAQQPAHGAGRDFEVDVAQDPPVAEALADAACLDGDVTHGGDSFRKAFVRRTSGRTVYVSVR